MFGSARLLAACVAALGLAVGSGAAAATAAACPNVGFTVVEPKASSETRPVRIGKHQTIFVRRDALTTTADIARISLKGDDEDTLILITFKPAAAARLHDATTDHSGMRAAFVADDDVLMAFTWSGPYGMDTDGSQLSILHGMARARPLVEAIRRCTGASGGERTP